MPTNGERRTVAENLRYEVDYPWRPIQYMEQFIVDLREIIFNDPTSVADYSEMLSRLADLIDPEPERTCRLSETDHEYEASYRCDACNRVVWRDFKGNPRPNYCPNCGARVAMDE